MALGASHSSPAIGQSEKWGSFPDTKGTMFAEDRHTPVLYATPSYSALYDALEDPEPGPGSYDLQGSLGLQASSKKLTAPSIAMADKNDHAWSKVLISKGHNKALLCRGSPGAGTYNPELTQSQASVRFSLAKRGDAPGMKPAGYESPGPMYDCRGAPGDPTAEGNFRARTVVGKDRRWASEEQIKAMTTLGPGQYESGTAFDGLHLSKTFGCSMRAYDKVITPGFDRFLVGQLSPGPGPYREEFARGGRSHSFAKATRLRDSKRHMRTPGPGAYDDHEKIEIARLSTMDSLKKTPKTTAFGKPSNRARLDFRSLQKFQSSCWGLH